METWSVWIWSEEQLICLAEMTVGGETTIQKRMIHDPKSCTCITIKAFARQQFNVIPLYLFQIFTFMTHSGYMNIILLLIGFLLRLASKCDTDYWASHAHAVCWFNKGTCHLCILMLDPTCSWVGCHNFIHDFWSLPAWKIRHTTMALLNSCVWE